MAENVMTVQCDAPGCDWSKPENVDNMKVWHNAPCPKCGHKPVCSDEDMELLAALVALRDMGLSKIGTGVNMDRPSIDVKINTRSLRNGTDGGSK